MRKLHYTLLLNSENKAIAARFVREFWAPFLISVLITGWGRYKGGEAYHWFDKGILNFFAAGWAFSQWNRIKKQKRTEDGLGNVQSQVSTLITQLEESTSKLAGYTTGGDSYCYLARVLPGDMLPHLFHLKVHGDFPMRNLMIRALNINRLAQAGPAGWNENVKQYDHLRADELATISMAFDPVAGFVDPEGTLIRIYAESLNGMTEQYMRLVKTNNLVVCASIVFRGNTILREEISPEFPRNPDGSVDWGDVDDPTIGKTRSVKIVTIC